MKNEFVKDVKYFNIQIYNFLFWNNYFVVEVRMILKNYDISVNNTDVQKSADDLKGMQLFTYL